MESPSANHLGPRAPISDRPRTDPCEDRGNALKYFEEGIQDLRREHKHTESRILGLRQEMEKATTEILESCQRMESELTRCTAFVNNGMKEFCSQPQGLQSEVSYGEDRTVNEAQTRQCQSRSGHALTQPVMSTIGEIVDMIGRPRDFMLRIDPSKSIASVHSTLLDEIEQKNKRRKEIEDRVALRCRCYHALVPYKLVLLVHSVAFNTFCALITVAFAVLVGLEADSHISSVLYGRVIPKWINPATHVFNCCFVLEVAVRLLADGDHYFITKDWCWNIFDMVCAMLSVADMVAQTGPFAFTRVLRALKIAKTVRIVRVLRLLDDVRLIVASTLASLVSLLWSLVFLVTVIYLAAVTFVDAAAAYVEDNGANHVRGDIDQYYNSLPNTMYTLLMCTTSGMDWSDGAAPMWHFSWVYGWAFLCYILFCLLGILNVITSVFVDKASTVKHQDRDYAISQELLHMETDIEDTMDLFSRLVESGTREITIPHLEELLSHQLVMAHFASLGMEISDPAFVSRALGDMDAGCVDLRSFVKGCISLRGPARQTDTLSIISHVQKLESVLVSMMKDTAQDFKLVAQLAVSSHMFDRNGKIDLTTQEQINDFEARLADLEINRAIEALVYNKS